MATVRLLIELTGTRNGVEWPPRGALMELPDQEAADMVANGYARFAEPPAPTPPVPERAVVEAPEAAVVDVPEAAVVDAPERRGGRRK